MVFHVTRQNAVGKKRLAFVMVILGMCLACVAGPVRADEQEKPKINFKRMAIELGEGLKNQTSLNEIGRMASTVFGFDVSPHPHTSITSSRSQTVYDWVMTLSEQPISEEKKSQLLKQFINALTPEDNPLRKLVGGQTNGN